MAKKTALRPGLSHGESRSRLYKVWTGLKQRCENPNRKEYPNYGGRGIAVCEEWQTYIPFREWALGNGYEETLDLDRVDNDGNYEPENCQWVTRSENLRNNRRSKKLEAFGETKSMIEWSEDDRCVVPYATLESRLRRGGWEVEAALTTAKGTVRPNRNPVLVQAFGEEKTFSGWAKDSRCVVSVSALRQRVEHADWDPEDAILTPKGRWNPKRRKVS